MDRNRELIQFITTHPFDRMADGLLDDDDLRLVQQTLQETPEAGDMVQGTRGLRKLRISVPGRGKRGGGRLLYLYVEIRGVIYFVAVFSKTAQADLTAADYRVLAEVAKRLKKES